MNYQTIAEIYESNDRIRENLKTIIGNVSKEQAARLPDGEKWTLAELIEHVAIVEDGMTKICAKLLAKAQTEQKKADGTAKISADFLAKAAASVEQKLEAPDRVRPTGTKTIAESLRKMEENRETLKQMRPLFESFDGSEYKFPHPAFGALSAHEWLALIGGHELRHMRQIKKMLEKIS
jgi:uncharacterized damage-inducible protein DinB